MNFITIPSAIVNRKVCSLMILLFLLTGCDFSQPIERTLVFEPVYHNKPIACSNDASFQHNKQAWHLSQLQFFVSELEYQTDDEQWQEWPMVISEKQTKNNALIGEICGDKPVNSADKWSLKLTPLLAYQQVTKLRFKLGVPFEQNHLNPLTQDSPLNDSSMFWVWRNGHKFLRLELFNKQADWIFHLGSTGCSSASPVRSPKLPCLNANLPMMTVDVNPDDFLIKFDIAALLAELQITNNNSCKSEPENSLCQQLFSRLNIGEISQPPFIIFR